jgi:hypothetical protein
MLEGEYRRSRGKTVERIRVSSCGSMNSLFLRRRLTCSSSDGKNQNSCAATTTMRQMARLIVGHSGNQ